MSTQELREKAHQAIEQLPPKALQKFVELLEELNVLTQSDQSDDALIERIIKENRDALSRLAQ
jgi:hypothetical protein